VEWRGRQTALAGDPLAQKTGVLPMAIVDLRTDNDGKRLGIAVLPTCDCQTPFRT
jgi:hypothetical protein